MNEKKLNKIKKKLFLVWIGFLIGVISTITITILITK